jgi:hypothetical protein
MKLKLKSKFSRYIAILITIVISFMLIMDSAKSWFSYIYAGDPPPNGLKYAYSLESGNAEFYFLLAQYYNFYDYTFPRENIYPLYKKALELNPFNYGYWYSLAQFLSMQNRKDDARFALKQAVELSPGVVALRWEAAMMASELGDRESVLSNLRPVIASDPHRRKRAFVVLWHSIKDGEVILDVISDEALPQYLHFLIDTERPNEAVKVWNRLPDKTTIPDNAFVRYISFLIREGYLNDAKLAWVERLEDWEGIWNSDFEDTILDGGFDWRTSSAEGAKVTQKFETSENTRLVKIEFDGDSESDHTYLTQFIPLTEDTKYSLDIRLKSKDLFTGGELLWEVYCPSEKKSLARTPNIRGISDWRNISLSFETPYGCNLVTLRLRSSKDRWSGKKMSGSLWIDKVAMKETN